MSWNLVMVVDPIDTYLLCMVATRTPIPDAIG